MSCLYVYYNLESWLSPEGTLDGYNSIFQCYTSTMPVKKKDVAPKSSSSKTAVTPKKKTSPKSAESSFDETSYNRDREEFLDYLEGQVGKTLTDSQKSAVMGTAEQVKKGRKSKYDHSKDEEIINTPLPPVSTASFYRLWLKFSAFKLWFKFFSYLY